jgi:HEAT repeat protein
MTTRRIAWICTAWGCLALAAPALRAGEPSVAELIGGLKAADEAARLKTIDQIGARGDKAAEAVAPLTELLKDGSAKVRAHALWALGAIGAAAKPAVPAMAELLKDADENVRRQVVQAVRAIRPGAEVTVPLCVKLMEDPDPAVRVRMLTAIAEAGKKAVPGLIEGLKNEKAAYWACLVLRDIGADAAEAVPALTEKLKDPRPEIRREAVLTLGAIGPAAAAAIPQIAALLTDQHVRTAATFTLGELGQIPADADAAVRAAAKGDDRLLATVSLWALARVHPEDKDLRREATEQLITRLKEKEPFVRVAAARALAALPPAPEITGPIWERVLADADETTVHHALDALASIGAPAVPRLTAALKHEHLRAEIIYVLGHIGPAAAPATAALAKLIDDKNARVAHEAVLALGAIGPGAKEAVPALIRALEQPEDKESNFCAIACCLGKIGPDAAAAQPVLLERVKSTDTQLALMSAWALAQICPASADAAAKTVPVLTAGLALDLAEDRELAAEALGRLGPLAKDAAAALQKAAADPDKVVREAAAQALAAVGQPAAGTASAAEAPPIGSVVVPKAEGAKLQMGRRVLAKLPSGSRITVLQLKGDWLGVEVTIDGKPVIGWVHKTDVAPAPGNDKK